MALPIDINELLNGDVIESNRLEFKRSWNPLDVLHTICAFANDINNIGGGYICIGIEEKDGKALLPPLGIAMNQCDGIQKKLLELCKKMSPNYFPQIEFVKIQTKTVLVIWAPGGDNRPYKAPVKLSKGSPLAFYLRRFASTVKANHSEEQELYENTAKIPFDDRINQQASLQDLDFNLIKDFLIKINSKLASEIDNHKAQDIAIKMNIAKGAKEYLKPTNIGLLMFNPNPEQYFPGAYTELIEYINNEDEFIEKKFIGPIHLQIKQILDFISRKLIVEKTKKLKGKAEAAKIYNYPFAAIEEAVVNAFYHRSYELPNPIEINIRNNYIEILSFPGPLPPVDQSALKKDIIVARNYRNRRIGDILKELRLTEGRGTGIAKIRKSLKQNGSPAPKFETDKSKSYFLTTIYIHPEFETLKPNEKDEEPNNQEKRILNFCKTAKTKKEIFTMLKLSVNQKNHQKYIVPLLKSKQLKLLYPESPNHPKQKYVRGTK